MPTSNLVCTSMAVTIVDPLKPELLPAAVYVKDGAETIIESPSACTAVEEFNITGGGEFYLSMPLTKLNHAQFPLAVIDTPGVNDGMDDRFSHLANDILLGLNAPTVLYVSHVRSCGTSDEERCLRDLARTMNEKKLSEWFVAINGWNFLDMEHLEEDRQSYLQKVYIMAQKCGLPKPQVFFIAALPAELCVKCLEGKKLSRSEEIKLDEYLNSFDLRSRAKSNKRTLGKISNKTLRTAMYHSGVTSLERALFIHFQKNRKG